MRRHKASHSQITPRRRWRTKLHSSSSSRMSWGWAGAKVASSGGNCWAFFEPLGNRVARHPENPGQSPQRGPLLISPQNLLFGRWRIAGHVRVLPEAAATRATPVTLLAVAGFSVLARVFATTMITVHRNIIASLTSVSHYRKIR